LVRSTLKGSFPETSLFPSRETWRNQETDDILFPGMPSFPDQETESNRKPPSEAEIHALLSRGELTVPPLTIAVAGGRPETVGKGQVDGFMEISWGRESNRFLYGCKSQSTPKNVANAVAEAVRAANPQRMKPMIIVPYLSEERLSDLEAQGVSGIDLCGNALVIGDKFRVLRTGRPNRYTSSSPIKNVFRGTSSLLARCFLIQPKFSTPSHLRILALQRSVAGGGDFSQPARFSKGTVSKVVQALVDDLIVAREGEGLRLIDAARLLSALRENYVPIDARPIEAKTTLSPDDCRRRLRLTREKGDLRSVVTGVGSAPRYGALSIENATMLYVNDANATLKLLEATPTRTFPNVKLTETGSEIPYFDARDDGQQLWASPIQTWIELATGGPRERDAAAILEKELAKGMAAG
jgi:hypothetical protein